MKRTLNYLGYEGNRPTSISLATKLNSMSGQEFEEFVAAVYKKKGYRIEYTQVTGDHGIDLVMRKDNKKTVVQCKRWNDSVGEPIVRDFFGSMVSEGADQGVIVTTASFTPQAVAFAANKPITLVDLDLLLQLDKGF